MRGHWDTEPEPTIIYWLRERMRRMKASEFIGTPLKILVYSVWTNKEEGTLLIIYCRSAMKFLEDLEISKKLLKFVY